MLLNQSIIIKLLLRTLKENHYFYEYISCQRESFGHKYEFSRYQDIHDFIVEVVKDENWDWSDAYDMLLVANELHEPRNTDWCDDIDEIQDKNEYLYYKLFNIPNENYI